MCGRTIPPLNSTGRPSLSSAHGNATLSEPSKEHRREREEERQGKTEREREGREETDSFHVNSSYKRNDDGEEKSERKRKDGQRKSREDFCLIAVIQGIMERKREGEREAGKSGKTANVMFSSTNSK